jgi:transposase
MKIKTIGIDLAKDVFQIYAVDSQGKVVVRKQIRRNEMLKFFANISPIV